MSEFVLPDDVYLGWRYLDGQRGVDRSQLYHDDGLVELVEGETRTELCRFNESQVAAAMRAVGEAGLGTAPDVQRGKTADAATVVYAWRLDGDQRTLTNSGYPATRIDALERLEAALARIEDEAGCGPLLADDEAAAAYAALGN
jgi:hypothetical protein